MKQIFLSVLLIVLLPFAVLAQESEDDPGFLAGKIQEALSGPGRVVKIKGFHGALSSRATIQELTVADSQGVWLTLREAAFDWNRAALLKKRLNVNEISAKELIVLRKPIPVPSTNVPSSTAKPFALPELPVSVEIGKLSIERADLGAPILGEAMIAKLRGGLSLVGGEGDVDISVTRTDGKTALLRLKGSYANESRILDLDLLLAEQDNGLVVTMLDLPGLPSLDLGVQGTGPLDGFSANLFMATDGIDRLNGDLVLNSTVVSPDGADKTLRDWTFNADVKGDLAALFQPDYKEFLGRSLTLSTKGAYHADGRLELDEISMQGASLTLQGQVALDAAHWPERIDIEGHIIPPGGERVIRLPLPGPETDLEKLDLKLTYDANTDDSWAITAWMQGLERGVDRLGAVSVLGQGQLSRNGDSDLPGSVTANLVVSGADIGIGNDGIDALLKDGLAAAIDLSWKAGQAVDITSFNASTGGISLSGTAQVSDIKNGGHVAGDIGVRIADLNQASALAGRPLAGQFSAQVRGQADLLSGGFQADITGTSTDVNVAIDELLPFLAGQATVVLSASRDETGTSLDRFELTSALVSASAKGTLSPEAGDLSFDASLSDVSVLSPELQGQVDLHGTAQRKPGQWLVDVNSDSSSGISAKVQGSLAEDFSTVDLSSQGTIPLTLASSFIAPSTLTGMLNFDVQVQGPPELNSVHGTIQTQDSRFSAPAARLALSDIDGQIDIANGAAGLALHSAISPKGQLAVTGSVGLTGPFPADIMVELSGVRLSDPALYDTTVDGQVSFTGPATGGAKIAGHFELGKTDVRIPSVIGGGGGNIAGLVHRGETHPGYVTRERAGFVESAAQSSGPPPSYPLDITIAANAGIFIRGRGLDAELGGEIHLLGSTDNLIPEGEFDLRRGRLDFLARRLELNEARISLEGAFVPTVYIEAGSTVDDTVVKVIVDGPLDDPEITFTSEPELPEDEALALLLFGTSVTNLTAIQAAELASAVAELAGKSGFSLISNLRESFGLDDLDIETDDEGNTTVRAGKYLSENVYTDVAVDSDGETEINLNLDITDSFTAKGSVSSDGNSSLGVFFEKEY